MRKISRIWPAAACAAVLATAGLVAQDDALTQRARGIHERVMTLDTHDDINAGNFTAECNYTMDLGNQVNLPKMIKGGLDAAFFIVYVGQSQTEDAFTPAGYDRAYKAAIEKFDADPPADRADRAGQDRPGAHVGGRAEDLRLGPEGGVHRRRERLPDRRGHQARQGVPRSRRALHVARAQRPQPALRLQHRRGARAGSGTACRRSASR